MANVWQELPKFGRDDFSKAKNKIHSEKINMRRKDKK